MYISPIFGRIKGPGGDLFNYKIYIYIFVEIKLFKKISLPSLSRRSTTLLLINVHDNTEISALLRVPDRPIQFKKTSIRNCELFDEAVRYGKT